MMQSQSFHLTVPRAQSCNFEAIHEFSTQSILWLNHSANSSANRTITLWFRHNPPDCGGFTPCRSASISIHTILWSFLQAIPDQKIHQQLQNLLTILGCLPQSVWITSRLQVRKGLQVDWKDCIEIGWIAEQQRKTMTTWVNSWTQHQSTALPPNFLRGSWIAPFFLQITPQCRWISRQFPNLMQSSQSRGLQRGSCLDCDWGQILTQTHDTKGGSQVVEGGCVTQFSNEIIFIEHSRLNSNRVDCRTIASKALFEPIPEFNCNPCPICGHLDHS